MKHSEKLLIAIDYMQTYSRNINDWNLNRSQIKSYLNQQELCFIDSSGLIIQVLGKDI